MEVYWGKRGMELKVKFFEQGTMDGSYCFYAPGCVVGFLSWADEDGALKNWIPFGYIPLDAYGRGSVRLLGGRGIPPAATHIYVRAVQDDLTQWRESLIPIPQECRTLPMQEEIHFCVMSDLHLSTKMGTVMQAFSMAKGADALLLAGDMTNDGTKHQYDLLKNCLSSILPKTPVFSVIGNHDIPRISPDQKEQSDTEHYYRFQKWLLEGTERKVPDIEYGPDGAYAVRLGKVEVIGLQVVTNQRKFLFKEGRQLEWLDQHLAKNQQLSWHLILCHAPLLHHNPKREAETNHPYLNRDQQLQEIVDRYGRVIFISGHTHLSMDNLDGCVEWEKNSYNLYVNDGSIRPTDLLSNEIIQPCEWKNGTVLDIRICDAEVEIITRSVRDGKSHARGYYRVKKGDRKRS